MAALTIFDCWQQSVIMNDLIQNLMETVILTMLHSGRSLLATYKAHEFSTIRHVGENERWSNNRELQNFTCGKGLLYKIRTINDCISSYRGSQLAIHMSSLRGKLASDIKTDIQIVNCAPCTCRDKSRSLVSNMNRHTWYAHPLPASIFYNPLGHDRHTLVWIFAAPVPSWAWRSYGHFCCATAVSA